MSSSSVGAGAAGWKCHRHLGGGRSQAYADGHQLFPGELGRGGRSDLGAQHALQLRLHDQQQLQAPNH